jgi:DNA-binding MarR family transcriptional regulator
LQQLFKTTMKVFNQYIRKKSLGHLSSRIHILIKNKLQTNLDDANINLKVELFPIVNRLFEEDQVPQQTIADWFSCDRHRMSRTLDELEKEGFIARKADPNSRRTNLICLTEYAKANKQNIQNAVLKVFSVAYAGFEDEEINKTIESLEKIINNLE